MGKEIVTTSEKYHPGDIGGLPLFGMVGVDSYEKCALVAENGRPIAELLADPDVLEEAKRAGIHFNVMPNTLPGSRIGVDTNVSSYEDLRGRFVDALKNLIFIYELCSPTLKRREDRDDTLNRDTTIQLVFGAAAMPAYIFNKASSPYLWNPIRVANTLADFVKITAGLRKYGSTIGPDMNKDGKYLSAQLSQEYAERKGIYNDTYDDGTVRSCPASERMVEEVFNALYGARKRNTYHITSEGATLKNYDIDVPRFKIFANAFAHYHAQMYDLNVAFAMAKEMYLSDPLQTKEYIMFSIQEHLKSLQEIQDDLNESLGRKVVNCPKVTKEILLENQNGLRTVMISFGLKP